MRFLRPTTRQTSRFCGKTQAGDAELIALALYRLI